jgi:hypothetical protein
VLPSPGYQNPWSSSSSAYCSLHSGYASVLALIEELVQLRRIAVYSQKVQLERPHLTRYPKRHPNDAPIHNPLDPFDPPVSLLSAAK